MKISLSPNECDCPLGPDDRFILCQRHQVKKYRRDVELCRMRGNYWEAWENGSGPRQPGSKAHNSGGPRGGPGTELKKIIASWQSTFPGFDLAPKKGCGCEQFAAWMNQLGPDGCEEHMDEIIDKLGKEAAKRKLSIPFQRFWAKRMVKQAIHRARLKHSPI